MPGISDQSERTGKNSIRSLQNDKPEIKCDSQDESSAKPIRRVGVPDFVMGVPNARIVARCFRIAYESSVNHLLSTLGRS